VNFTYTNQVLIAFRRTITDERLTNYLASSGGDSLGAVRLYVANTRLCEAFYTPLQGVEVALRNAMNGEMVTRYGLDWIEQRKAPLLPIQREMAEKAVQTLIDDHKPVANRGLVAELNFGFWVGILGPKYEVSLWRPTLRKAFPHRPKGVERHEVQGALNSIRRLRNRVMHHERILHRDLPQDHALTLDIIGWICPETQSWVAAHSTFDSSLIP
jgi:hypothetical protein